VDGWMWAVLVIATASMVGLVWWKRRARRVYVIDHVKLEMHPACIVEDRVVEQVWRAAILMTNTSRRPRVPLVLAERVTVRCGSRSYLASAFLDADPVELNPGGVALVWVEAVLPSASRPRSCALVHLRTQCRPRSLRFLWSGTRRSDLADPDRPMRWPSGERTWGAKREVRQ